jgi:hypothetical protein
MTYEYEDYLTTHDGEYVWTFAIWESDEYTKMRPIYADNTLYDSRKECCEAAEHYIDNIDSL